MYTNRTTTIDKELCDHSSTMLRILKKKVCITFSIAMVALTNEVTSLKCLSICVFPIQNK